MDINFNDSEQKKPLIRAIENTAYRSIKFLAFNYPETLPSETELLTHT